MINRQGQGGGSSRRLDLASAEKLKHILKEEQPFWTLAEIKALIAERFAIQYCDRHLRRLLKAWGMYHYKPQPQDYRRSEHAEQQLQQRLQATFDALLRQELALEEVAIGLADETGTYLQANTARLWSFAKQAKRKVNTEKIKQNTFGFYALQGNSLAVEISASSQEELLRILPLIRQANANYKAIVLLWDNLPSHKTAAVERQARRHQIYLVNNLPYAPDLNPIEKIWKQLKYTISQHGWIANKQALEQIVSTNFNQLADKLSWASAWIEKILRPALPQQYATAFCMK